MTDPLVPLDKATDAPDDDVADEGEDFDPSTRGPEGPAPVASENDDDQPGPG